MTFSENSTTPDVALRTQTLPGETPTVVFINGLGETLDFWHPVTVRLDGVDMLLYDRAVCSLDEPEGTLAAEIEHIDKVLSAVVGTVVLVGHSYGGILAEAYTRARPDRVGGLILLDPSVPAEYADSTDSSVGKVRRGSQRAMTSTRVRPVLKRVLPRAMVSFGTYTNSAGKILKTLPEDLAQRLSDPRHIERAIYDNTHVGNICAELLDQRTETALPAIPVHIMVGALGPRMWPRKQHSWIAEQRKQLEAFGPDAHLVELDGAHMLMLDCPDDVCAAIRGVHADISDSVVAPSQ